MTTHSFKSIAFKLLAFWLTFLLLHFGYEWFRSPIIAVFAGTSEGVAQHIKMSFFAYSFVSFGEYFILRLPKKDRLRFLDSRLLGALLISVGTFLWYIVPAIRGVGMPNDLVEIMYANVVILLVGVGVIEIERDLAQRSLSNIGRIVALVFFVLLGTILIIGSFKVPWGGFWVM